MMKGIALWLIVPVVIVLAAVCGAAVALAAIVAALVPVEVARSVLFSKLPGVSCPALTPGANGAVTGAPGVSKWSPEPLEKLTLPQKKGK